MPAFGLHLHERRAFAELQTDPDGNRQQQDRDQERDAPAIGLEIVPAHGRLDEQDHQQRHEQPQRRRGLDPTGVEAATASRRMFGDVGRCAAILAPDRQTLQDPQADQNDGGGDADTVRGRQDAHDEGGRTHDQDRHQEGVFASDEIAKAPEYQRTERAHQEAGGEGQQGEDIARRLIELTEELGADDHGKRTVEIKIVPLENRAERRGQDYFLLVRGHRPNRGGDPAWSRCAYAHGCHALPYSSITTDRHSTGDSNLIPPPTRMAGLRSLTHFKDLGQREITQGRNPSYHSAILGWASTIGARAGGEPRTAPADGVLNAGG